MKINRSFDSENGRAFEDGKMTLEDLSALALAVEPKMRSGKQELFENIINQYI